jgi:hypothetical protein
MAKFTPWVHSRKPEFHGRKFLHSAFCLLRLSSFFHDRH